MGRIELPTSPLPRECSTTEPHGQVLLGIGAGEGNRTLVISLEGFCSTIELHPLRLCDSPSRFLPHRSLHSGGGGWIRTNVGVSQQIYSLPPLATRAPLRRERMIMTATEQHVKLYAGPPSVRALTYNRFFGAVAGANAKTPASWAGGGLRKRFAWDPSQRSSAHSGRHRVPDDYLLSHGDPHYHRRGVVSRSCSGWEGVVPTRCGHQA
jgi:hypothetical protein